MVHTIHLNRQTCSWLSFLSKCVSSFENFYNHIIISPEAWLPVLCHQDTILKIYDQQIKISGSFGAIKVHGARNTVFTSFQPREPGRNCILLRLIRAEESLSCVCMWTVARTDHFGGQRAVCMIYEPTPTAVAGLSTLRTGALREQKPWFRLRHQGINPGKCCAYTVSSKLRCEYGFALNLVPVPCVLLI